jgi:predicted nucleic acid-binding protein
MSKKIFLDANILVDLMDEQRTLHPLAKKIVIGSLQAGEDLFTSCDIVTTLYYLSAKSDKKRALNEIVKINMFCKVIEFSNGEVAQTCALMSENEKFLDLEDTIQYVLAKKYECDVIITNDQQFYSPDIALHTSKSFLELL